MSVNTIIVCFFICAEQTNLQAISVGSNKMLFIGSFLNLPFFYINKLRTAYHTLKVVQPHRNEGRLEAVVYKGATQRLPQQWPTDGAKKKNNASLYFARRKRHWNYTFPVWISAKPTDWNNNNWESKGFIQLGRSCWPAVILSVTAVLWIAALTRKLLLCKYLLQWA